MFNLGYLIGTMLSGKITNKVVNNMAAQKSMQQRPMTRLEELKAKTEYLKQTNPEAYSRIMEELGQSNPQVGDETTKQR